MIPITTVNLVSDRQFLRGTEATNTTQDDEFSCFQVSETGATVVVDDERCKRMLLVQPILMALFVILLVYCCWKKSMSDISDSYWCCCRKQRLKRQRQHEGQVAMTTMSGTSMIQTRIADSTRDEQEQREIQQRQLPIMASIRRRERELHRIRLETNARLEKIQLRVAEETNARRVLLVEKFKKSGLEKILTDDDFVPSLAESDTTVREDKSNTRHNQVDQSDSEREKQLDISEGEDPENQESEESVSNLCIKWNRCDGEKTSIYPNECAICLQEYRTNEVIAFSDNPSCVHCYHRDCIVEYLIPLLDFEENNQSRVDNSSHGDEISIQPSQLTLASCGGKGLPCPCCRLPFIVDPPRIDEGLLPPPIPYTG